MLSSLALYLALIPLGLARSVDRRSMNSGQFSLWTASNDTAIAGRTIAEESSTDDGASSIILADAGSTDMQIQGFLMDQATQPAPGTTFFLVNSPVRSGGSEYDGWVVGAANASGIALPQIVPAGGTTGWSLANVTAANGTVTRQLVFEAGGKTADFFACDTMMGGVVKQQFVFAFDAAPSAGCSPVQILASF